MELTESSNENSQFDRVMKLVGHGRFQTRFIFLFGFLFPALITALFYNFYIALVIPDHWCMVPKPSYLNFTPEEWKKLTIPRQVNTTQNEEYESCLMYNVTNVTATSELFNVEVHIDREHTVECQSGWNYDTTWFGTTIPSTENWVCSNEINFANAMTCASLGTIIGSILLGYIGDRYGPRKVYLLSLLIILVGKSTTLFTTGSFFIFAASQFVTNIPWLITIQSASIVIMEICDPCKRAQVALWGYMAYILAILLVPLIYWPLGDWFLFSLITSLPVAVFIVCQRYFIESPRWLLSIGKIERCAAVLKEISKVNGMSLPEEIIDVLENVKEEEEMQKLNENRRKESLHSSWIMIKLTIIMILGRTASQVIYDVVHLNVSYVSGNPYVNYFLQGIIEIPTIFFSKYLADTIGRRHSRLVLNILAAIGCIAMIFLITSTDMAITLLSIFIKFGVTGSFYIVQFHAIEVYPTAIRQIAIAANLTISGFLSLCVPYVTLMGVVVDKRAPYIFFTVLTFLGAFSALMSPETLNRILPEKIEDAERLYTEQKFW